MASADTFPFDKPLKFPTSSAVENLETPLYNTAYSKCEIRTNRNFTMLIAVVYRSNTGSPCGITSLKLH